MYNIYIYVYIYIYTYIYMRIYIYDSLAISLSHSFSLSPSHMCVTYIYWYAHIIHNNIYTHILDTNVNEETKSHGQILGHPQKAVGRPADGEPRDPSDGSTLTLTKYSRFTWENNGKDWDTRWKHGEQQWKKNEENSARRTWKSSHVVAMKPRVFM